MMGQVAIGGLIIGGGRPVRVESMLKTPLSDREGCIKQCLSLAACGCELIRVAFPTQDQFSNLKWLNECSPAPLMADIHFDPKLALAALEAGVPSIRINPGNMARSSLRDVITSARERGAVIRIGANGGSLNNDQLRRAGGVRSEALATAVEDQLVLLLDEGFEDIILSAKSTSVQETVQANSRLARKFPGYPFHIGITESGYGRDGLIKSAAGLALLLNQGIGDTIRVSLTEPPDEEVRVGYSLLKALDLRHRGGRVISCPTCGRRRIDVRGILNRLAPTLETLPDGVTIAVMGCEVNGPREAMDADFGIAGSPGGAVLFCRGEVLREVSLEEAPETLAKLIKEHDEGGQQPS